ncbi:MAG: 3-(3-hydroxy-phenyl)propionate transporter MhpT [Gammaproteobacteria bacterium]|nr:3-(3-hydroxy-phenyl)propionate transporter MhpT [Gammaproteobacteria bacterium]
MNYHATNRPASVMITVALCFSVAVLEGFDIQAIGVAAPRLVPELGLEADQMGWIFSIVNIGIVIGAAFGGRLADRIGRKPVFMGAVSMFGLFTLATAFAGSFASLFAVRLLVGLGFGAALPNMMAVASEISRPERRTITAAAMFCGLPFGGGFSALLTQIFSPETDWRVLFYIGGGLPLVIVPALYFWMTETLQRGKVETAARAPIGEALFSNGRASPTLLLWLTFFPTLLILYLILNWLPTLVAAQGLDPAVTPRASLWFNFGSIPGALLFGLLVDRLGPRWPLAASYVALVVSLALLGGSTTLGSIVFFSGAAGFFLMGANYSLYGVAAAYYPTSMRGTGSGASVAVGRVGAVVGPMLAGTLLSQGLSATQVILAMVPAAAIAGVSVFLLSFYRQAD